MSETTLRSVLVAGAFTVLTVGLAACSSGPSVVDKDDLVGQITAKMTDASGNKPESVTCPQELKAEVGAQVNCDMKVKAQTFNVNVTVTSIADNEANFDMVETVDKNQVADTISNRLAEQVHRPDSVTCPDNLKGDFAHAMVYALRGDVEALIATGHHMMDTFPPPETVTDPLHFFHPRVYCWMALGEAVRGDAAAMREYVGLAKQLAQSRGDVFNILAAKLTLVECAAICGTVEGTPEQADLVDREFCAAGGQQWAAAARIIRVWAQTLDAGDTDAAVAFEAFEVLTSDGSTAMTPVFLALLADIEVHHRRFDRARELLDRASRVADATGEHLGDRLIAERMTALSLLTDQTA